MQPGSSSCLTVGMSNDAALAQQLHSALALVWFGLVRRGPVTLHNCPRPQATDLQTKQQAEKRKEKKKVFGGQNITRMILRNEECILGILAQRLQDGWEKSS